MAALLALLLALVFRTVAFAPFNILSGSMQPTLMMGDYLFVEKYSYGYSARSLPFSAGLPSGRILGAMPERGDVVVFTNSQDGDADYIKRIVGLPGDHIQLRRGILFVNGQAAARQPTGTLQAADEAGMVLAGATYRETLPGGPSYDIEQLTSEGFANNTPDYIVPPGDLFTLGDNRDNSLDSRFAEGHGPGFVPVDNLVGRASFIFFSVEGNASWWQLDKWPHDIRWGRVLSTIR